jgi:predicted site-specific integrase-resolvase
VSTTLAVSSALSLGSLTVIAMTNYRLGYARVSTLEQDPASQLAALTEVGCQEVFTDYASGLLTERPELTRR